MHPTTAQSAILAESLKAVERQAAWLQRGAIYLHERGQNPFRRLTAVERIEAHRPPAPPKIARTPPRPRSRRPRAQATRSSVRSGDSGDDGPGEPKRPRARLAPEALADAQRVLDRAARRLAEATS